MVTGVLIHSENRELSLQLLAIGKELAEKTGSKLTALTLGQKIKDAGELIMYGADEVYLVDDSSLQRYSVEAYHNAILKAYKKANPSIILIGASKRGKVLAARVAAALNTGCMTECMNIDLDKENRLIGERLVYGGSTIATEISKSEPHIATIPPRAYQKLEPSNRTGDIIKLDIEIPLPKVTVLERREKKKSDKGLEDASIVVSAGRGFKNQKDIELLEDLAEILDAKIGCSRPVAADMGWLEEWIGISGVKIKPKLYVACGISGTIQHAAGIRDSQTIISINMDENANIHELADYSIIGDLYSVIPALTNALKRKMK